jgi:Xaa-Pro dipeptidase
MRHRSERIFAAIRRCTPAEAVRTVVLMNGAASCRDSTFKYVSGVVRGGYEGCSAILRVGERTALVVSALEEESATTSDDCDVFAFATPAARDQVLKGLLDGETRLGVHAAALSLQKARALEALLPGVALVDVGGAIAQARLVKDESEIDRVREACRVTSEVAEEIPEMLREGMTELDLAAEIANAVFNRGGNTAFDTIVCFGPNGSQPHYSPGDVPLSKGSMILVDFGARLHDYCSDITRMYVLGRSTPAQRAMFDVVRRAQQSAIALTTAGTPGKDVHRRAREIIDASEFNGRFIHGTGHSIGLDVHDGAGLNDASEITLEPGMIMTIEPGVYVPGVGGVRIEDTVLVTENGPEILTSARKDLIEVPA